MPKKRKPPMTRAEKMLLRAATKAAHDAAPRAVATRGPEYNVPFDALLALTNLKMLGRHAILWAVLSVASAAPVQGQGFT